MAPPGNPFDAKKGRTKKSSMNPPGPPKQRSKASSANGGEGNRKSSGANEGKPAPPGPRRKGSTMNTDGKPPTPGPRRKGSTVSTDGKPAAPGPRRKGSTVSTDAGKPAPSSGMRKKSSTVGGEGAGMRKRSSTASSASAEGAAPGGRRIASTSRPTGRAPEGRRRASTTATSQMGRTKKSSVATGGSHVRPRKHVFTPFTNAAEIPRGPRMEIIFELPVGPPREECGPEQLVASRTTKVCRVALLSTLFFCLFVVLSIEIVCRMLVPH